MIFPVLITLILLIVAFFIMQRRRKVLFGKRVNKVYSQEHLLRNSVSLEDDSKRPRYVALDMRRFPLDPKCDFSEQAQSTLGQEARNLTEPSDLMADLKLNLQEAQLGTDLQIKIKHLELCTVCQGKGCDYCSAQGAKQASKRLIISIPPKVESGTCLRVRGEGDNGGDLYIYLLVGTNEIIQEGS